MTDPEVSLYQQAILARAADLRAVATEMDMSVTTRLVEESRKLREGSARLRSERYRSRSAERARELGEDR